MHIKRLPALRRYASFDIMPIFRPLDCGLALKTSLSTLQRLVLDGRALQADFLIPEDTGRRLRVSFADVEIIRTLDEMPLSTEETEKWVGLQSEHFAYEVTDAHFWRSQSEALKLTIPDLKHYCFITGWTCLDVISKHPPIFSVIHVDEDSDHGES